MSRIEDRTPASRKFTVALVGLVAAVSASALLAAGHAPGQTDVAVSPFDPAAGTAVPYQADAPAAVGGAVSYFPAQFPDRGRQGGSFDAPTF